MSLLVLIVIHTGHLVLGPYVFADSNAPHAMSWAANSEYTYDGSPNVQALAIWDTVSFGNSANMAAKLTWTCPAAGLWHIWLQYEH